MTAENLLYNHEQDSSLKVVKEEFLDSFTMSRLWTESMETFLSEEDIHELIAKTVLVHSPAIRTAAFHVQDRLSSNNDGQVLMDRHKVFMQISHELATRKGRSEELKSQILEQERKTALIEYGKEAFQAHPAHFSTIVTEELIKYDQRVKRDSVKEFADTDVEE